MKDIGNKMEARFEELHRLQNKYKHRINLMGDLESFPNLIKLACFKNDSTIKEWTSFRINDNRYIIFFNRK